MQQRDRRHVIASACLVRPLLDGGMFNGDDQDQAVERSYAKIKLFRDKVLSTDDTYYSLHFAFCQQ